MIACPSALPAMRTSSSVPLRGFGQVEALFADDLLGHLDGPEPEVSAIVYLDRVIHRDLPVGGFGFYIASATMASIYDA